MTTTQRLACAPLSGRILLGHTNKAGTAFTGEKRDVTSDFMRTLIEKAEYHGGNFEIEGSNGHKWQVVVVKSYTPTGDAA